MGAYDEIRTARLRLRRWLPADREPFAVQNASRSVMRFFPAPMTTEQSDAYVDRMEEHFEEHGYGLWAVEVEGELAGACGLMWQQGLPVDPGLEVGWRFAERFWDHGYATEAARAALEVGLEVAPQVISVTAIINERSWRVMERLGLERLQEFDHPRVEQGHPLKRHYLYSTP